MARRWTPLLLLLLALGVIGFVLTQLDDAQAPPGGGEIGRGGATDGEAPPPRREEPSGPALTGAPGAGGPSPREPYRGPIPTDQIPRGALEVLVLRPDDVPYPANDITVRLEREESPFWAPPLGIPDYETGVWSFEKVPIGRVRVLVFGDHVIYTVRRAEVREGRRDRVEVFADRGGAIRYHAELYSGEAPPEVTLELKDAQTGKVVEASWQVRLPDLHTSDRRASRVTQGPEGWIFAIPAGRYQLHAESPEGEIDVADVTVGQGETVDVDIRLRK